jgi:DNA-binding transcriptional ArsR family regulator
VTVDDLRGSVERRLGELADVTERLKAALAALTARDTPPTGAPAKAPRPSAAERRQAPGSHRNARATKTTVGARGATRRAVLDALADGSALTAGDIATATGLGRGSVSTTLSNLLAAGQVLKADRGYTRAHPTPEPPTRTSDPEQPGQPPAGTDPGLAAIRSELAAGLGR